jgi:hypothetical protein
MRLPPAAGRAGAGSATASAGVPAGSAGEQLERVDRGEQVQPGGVDDDHGEDLVAGANVEGAQHGGARVRRRWASTGTRVRSGMSSPTRIT